MGWIQCKCYTHRKLVGVKQWYNPVQQTVELVGVRQLERRCCRENQHPAEGYGPSGPPIEQSAEWERSADKDKETRGQDVAVCSVSNSPLTHNLFATLSQPFQIKCVRSIFLKSDCLTDQSTPLELTFLFA